MVDVVGVEQTARTAEKEQKAKCQAAGSGHEGDRNTDGHDAASGADAGAHHDGR
jgi:hypothetical protein